MYVFVCVCLQAKHTQENSVNWGVDGETGCLSDMMSLGIWEPLAVKAQTYKTAVEVRKHHTHTNNTSTTNTTADT